MDELLVMSSHGCKSGGGDTAFYQTFCPRLNVDFTYFIAAPEIGASGTPHYQGYIQFINKKSWKQCKDYLPEGCGYQAKAIADKQAAEYCAKEGAEGTISFGTKPLAPGGAGPQAQQAC